MDPANSYTDDGSNVNRSKAVQIILFPFLNNLISGPKFGEMIFVEKAESKVSRGNSGRGVNSRHPLLFSGEEGLHFQTWYAARLSKSSSPCIPSLKMQALFSAKQERASGIYPASGITLPCKTWMFGSPELI